MALSSLWTAPEVNPVNNKARSIPYLNPFNVYGRVFHFAWFGFFIAFWTWFAFPPLLADVIAKDVGITSHEVSNSNVIALTATLIVRLIAGPCCDRFGPRLTFVGCLLLGSIPGFCSGGINGPAGLYAVRFFVGILGGSFVPCQVWTTGFFDKNVVGFANALTAGFGNAGGGVTYFVMPAIYNSLMKNGLSSSTAWRVDFIFPSLLIAITAISMLFLCPDTPVGKWSDRETAVEHNLQKHNMVGVVDVPGAISTKKGSISDGGSSPERDVEKKPALLPPTDNEANFSSNEAHLTGEQMMETAKGETIRKPTFKEILTVCASPQTLVTAAAYFCSFGAELAINGILGPFYAKQYGLSLQQSGNWAAMFGLLNVVFRPLGGLVADKAYKATGNNVWAKKVLLISYGVITGAFLVAIGVLNTKSQTTQFGLIAGMAFFLEGGNGLNFALVPHVHPYANGVVSGFTGAAGNLGGIVFAIIFRYSAKASHALWVIGVVTIVLNLVISWIPPIPRGQIGGR